MHRIGSYLIGGVGPHLANLAVWQPSVITILDPSAADLRALRNACPDSLLLARIYVPDSECNDRIRADPQAAAIWTDARIRAHPAFGLANFWHIANEICQDRASLPLLNAYEVARMQLAGAAYKCGILAFSVGNPDLVDWPLVFPALALAEQRGDVGLCHQYGWPDFQTPDPSWYAARLERRVLPSLPYPNLRWIVEEFGLDQLLTGVVGGWQTTPARAFVGGPPPMLRARMANYATLLDRDNLRVQAREFTRGANLTGDRYAELLTEAVNAVYTPRVLGYTVFCCGASHPWETYDIAGLAAETLARLPDASPPPDLAELLQARFGAAFSDLRATLPVHATARYVTRAEATIQELVIHHTATAPDVTWAAVANYHVGKGWAGISYHLGIRPDGTVQYLGDLATIRYHAGAANATSIGIGCAGNYDTDQPPPPMLAALYAVEAVLRAYLGRAVPVLGHRDAEAGLTVCPGQYLASVLEEAQPMPDPTDPRAANCRAFHVNAAGKVDGIQLVWTPVPSARYACVSAQLIDEDAAQGNCVVTVEVLNQAGIKTAERALMTWPYGEVQSTEAPIGPGNPNNQFTAESVYPSRKGVGPLGFFVGDVTKQPISDFIWGYGLPDNRHISGYVVFQERGAVVVVPPVATYPSLAAALRGEAEKHDVLSVNPAAALCKVGATRGLWPTSNEFPVAFGGVSYVAQRFRNPLNDVVMVLYCVAGQWQTVMALTW